ncbi:histidine utilization repressor [Coralloluteibacterium stylophorae]|uniref:Histidine utilization repressor n=1 Tax=Coralloluteibacterium stylophorae TaxID=1776034 RepID=A0A8J7VUW7_9GAMM|nr:histidine utilization repressor [Coralloluteibacterium stylophorae]MBS7455580.1 histidine utilization repressor [Coralloluteibacterium stylophorae]
MHQRIRGDIEARIRSGEWPPGHRVPPEHALMARYGCSRMTVNKALSLLADAGAVVRRRGAGSFVATPHPHIESVALAIPDIAHEVASRGWRYGFRLVARRLRAPRRRDAQELELAGAGRLLALQGLHLADGRPIALEDRLVAVAAVPEAATATFDSEPPGSWLLQRVPWTRAEHRISAASADADAAALLEVEPGTACLVLERGTWRGEQAVTRVRQRFRGDAWDLVARFEPGLR